MSTLNAGETLQPFKPLRNNLIFDSSGNLVGIQNDRANGTDLRLNGGSAGTFSSLVVQAAGTLDLYNTADQTTNYERLRADWSGNVARIYTNYGGSATQRQLQIGIAPSAGSSVLGSYIHFRRAATPFFEVISDSTGVAGTLAAFTSTAGASSGTQTSVAINPTINQSGTAGYTALDINPTETATGSGTKLLQRWAVGGTTKSEINNSGTYFAANVYCNLTGSIGWSTNSSSSNLDLALNRDAADTLALRRGANAQIFRVYNTYTDASNYERGIVQWVASDFQIGTQAAGTGTGRNLTFLVNGTGVWRVTASGGHFLAATDNSYDIGASGANRPRNVYIGGSTVIGAFHTVGVSTVAALPAAAGAARAQIFVSDSSVAAAGNFGAIVVGGGANIVPVFSDGTNWLIG